MYLIVWAETVHLWYRVKYQQYSAPLIFLLIPDQIQALTPLRLKNK